MFSSSERYVLLPQLVPVEMRTRLEEEEKRGYYGEASAKQIGVLEPSQTLGDATAHHQSDTDAHVPTGQIRGGGGAALIIGRQVHEQGIKRREHRPESHTLRERDADIQIRGEHVVPSHQALERGEQEKADGGQIHAQGNDQRNASFIDLPTGEKPRYRQADRHEGEIQTGVYVDPDLVRIHRHVGGGHAIRDGEQEQGNARQRSFHEEETIQRDRFPLHRRLIRRFYHICHENPQAARKERTKENHVVSNALVHEQADHRTEAHSDVVRQAIVAHSLAATGRGQDIDQDRIARHGHHAEGKAMHDAQGDKQRQHRSEHITGEDGGKYEISDQIQRTPREGVQEITREGTDTERRQRVAGQDEPDHRFPHHELFLQIEWQDGQD